MKKITKKIAISASLMLFYVASMAYVSEHSSQINYSVNYECMDNSCIQVKDKTYIMQKEWYSSFLWDWILPDTTPKNTA